MMDLRYHLASLMSVFLALAVGIVVGVSLGSSERQAGTIRSVQQDVAAIRSEDSRLKEVNNELQRRLAQREEAEEQELLPLAVRGRLAGNRVALLVIGDAGEELQAPITHALHLAGAEVIILRLPRGEAAAKDTATSRAEGSTRAAGRGRVRGGSVQVPSPASTSETSSAAETSAGMLARALLGGRPALLDEVRAGMPELEVIGEIHAPIRRLLLLCPNDQPEYARRVTAGSGVEAAFARAAREGEALLVAAEPEAARTAQHLAAAAPAGAADREATSLLPALSAFGASTVDHVDTALGQIAAVLALAGSGGHFGTGPGATQLLPPLPVEGQQRSPSHPSSPLPHP